MADPSNGMVTSVWGPPAWLYLHTVSFNYPLKPTEEQKTLYYEWLMNIGATLPCKYCRENFKTNLVAAQINTASFDSRDSFSRLVYRLHNAVSKALKKEGAVLPYDDVKKRYESFRAQGCSGEQGSSSLVSQEKGCTKSAQILAPKCQINIVPRDSKEKYATFKIDKRCQPGA